MGRRDLNKNRCVVKCTYLLLLDGRTGPDGQGPNSRQESLPAACWMRHLQRRAVSSGKRGSTRRSGPHNVPGQPIPGLEHRFPGTAFLTFTENFLCFDCARCPLRALLRRARTLRTPQSTTTLQSTPSPGRDPHGKEHGGKRQRGRLLPSSAVRRMGQRQERWNTGYPHADL